LISHTKKAKVRTINHCGGYEMITALNYVLYFGILASAIYSLVFSFKARRVADPIARGLVQAKMNIAMGIMLTLLSIIQLFMFQSENEGSTVRVLVGVGFLLLGLYNIFAGIRNNKLYKTQRNKQAKSKKN
jgi:hypothetical protein